MSDGLSGPWQSPQYPNVTDLAQLAVLNRLQAGQEDALRMQYLALTPAQRAAWDAEVAQRVAADLLARTRRGIALWGLLGGFLLVTGVLDVAQGRTPVVAVIGALMLWRAAVLTGRLNGGTGQPTGEPSFYWSCSPAERARRRGDVRCTFAVILLVSGAICGFFALLELFLA